MSNQNICSPGPGGGALTEWKILKEKTYLRFAEYQSGLV